MADKSFGVKELNLLNASGTPTVTSPNNLNLNANTVAISTSATVGNNLTVTSTTNSANLNVTGIGTITRAFATDLSVSGISTIAQPADSNPMANWTITNNSASAYRFTGPGQSGTEDNPNIYLVRGHRYIFRHNATGSHPIQIRVSNGGSAYTDGITYSEGNNTTTDGNNLTFNVQHDAPAQLYYQCTSHGSMVGNIYIVGGPQVISGVVTATTFVGNLTGNVTGTASANAVLTGSTNDQLVTVTGANAITGESGLTFNGSTLNLTSASGDARVTLIGTEGNDARLTLSCDDGDDHIDQYNLRSNASDNSFTIDQFESGSFVTRLRIANGGKIVMGSSTTSTTQLDIRFTDTTAYSSTDNRPNGLKIFNDSATDNGFAGIELAATDADDYYGSVLLKAIATGTNYSNDFVIQTRHGGNHSEKFRITSDGLFTFDPNAGGTLKIGGSSAHTSKIVIADNAGTGNGNCLIEGGDGTDFFTIQSNGNVAFTNGRGINFAATSDAGNSATMSNELFDDYEEGSWSPTGSWTTITARYTKVGRMVFAAFSLRANTSSGNVTIGGFPFDSDSNHAAAGGIAWGLCEFNSSSGWLNGSIGDGETTATIRKNNASVLTFGSGSNNLNNGAFLRGTFIYHTA